MIDFQWESLLQKQQNHTAQCYLFVMALLRNVSVVIGERHFCSVGA